MTRGPGRGCRLLLVAVSILLATACGDDGTDAGSTGPTVAPHALGGTYQLERLVVDGTDVSIDELGADGAPEVSLDAEFGGLRIDTACGALLGAFTLDADGVAGITVAGGSTRECSTAAADQREQLLASLSRVDAWSADDPADDDAAAADLELTSPTDALVLTRR